MRRGRLILPALLVVSGVGLLMYPLNAHSAPRYALTGAIWDDQSLAIDGYPLGLDKAVVEGQTFSDKAPGQPLWALPAYGIYRTLGGQPARTPQGEGNLGLWLVTLWSATLPAAALVSLMVFVSRDVDERSAVLAGLFTWGGTLLLPFSAALFGHVLAALLLFASFVALRKGRAGPAWPFVGGVLAGFAAVTEYSASLGVAVLATWLLVAQRPKIFHFVAGGLSPLLILALYNVFAFGSPFTISYQLNAFHGIADNVRPLFHMFASPSADNFLQLFFGPRGFLMATPIVFVGLLGHFRLIRSGLARDLGGVGMAMFAVFTALPVFWANPWGGDSPGPRYMIPAFAFLAPGVAVALRELPKLTIGTGILSFLTMGLATLTNPFVAGPQDAGGVGAWIELAREGGWAPSLMGLPQTVVAVLVIAGVSLSMTLDQDRLPLLWRRARSSANRFSGGRPSARQLVSSRRRFESDVAKRDVIGGGMTHTTAEELAVEHDWNNDRTSL